MTSQTDLEYFSARALIERDRARGAPSPAVARVHQELARGYEELVRQEQAPRVSSGVTA